MKGGLKKNNFTLMVSDLIESYCLYQVWSKISMKTMFIKYKRSKLGFLWPFLNSFLFAIIIAFIFSEILSEPFYSYAPYLITGFLIWNFYSSIINELIPVFVNNEIFIKELWYNLFFYIFKKLHEIFIIFIVNIGIYLLLDAFFFHNQSIKLFLLLINIPLILVLSVFVSFVFATINSFFRDFVFIVNNSMRLFFFVTPILWKVDNVSGLKSFLVIYNPFFYIVDLIRAPLINESISPYSFHVVFLLILFFLLVTLAIYKKVKHRVVLYI